MNPAATLRTIGTAVTLVYRSGPKELVVITAASIVTSGAIAGQLLVGRTLLNLLADAGSVDAGDLAPHLVMLGALLMVAALSQAIASELRIPLGEAVYRRTMDEILDVATEVDLEAYESADFYDRLQRASWGSDGESTAIVFGLVSIVSTLVIAAGVIGVLFTVAPVLVPVAILGFVPITVVNVRNNRARHELEHDLTELYRERSYLETVMTERSDAKEVRAYDVATTLRSWHRRLWDRRMKRLRELVRARLILITLGSLVTTSVLVATLSIAVVLAVRGSITIGDAAIAIVGLQRLSGRLQTAGWASGAVHEGVTFLQDFESFRAALPVIREQRPSGTPPVPTVLTVAGLGYRYPGTADDAVRDVSFELRRGQVMAIVGSNGSGKTTLAKMLCGLIPPTTGTIRWDGADIFECDPSLVRAQIAPVFQDYTRFQLTIRQSIGLGDVDRLDDDAAILAAARLAGLHELIDSHETGLDTRLGKEFVAGTDVSGGEWQRLAIARALFRDAPIIVMDEPSASLDPRGEAALLDLLHALGTDRIVIFVSHRFATVRSADVVMVLEQGEVVELGSHDELMKARGLYSDLFLLQAQRYGLVP
jgi:ATP-binding cassette, subfamily B, bacterial